MAAPLSPRISALTKRSFCISCTQVQPDIPVLWVDHGYNRPATYKHAEQLKKLLKLNLKAFLPKITAAHRDARFRRHAGPDAGKRGAHQGVQRAMKLEPFQRGMKELAPTVWITALRKVQNPNRAGLDIVSEDKNFGALKVSPVFYWSDADMEAYLEAAQSAERVGLFRSGQGRRQTRVRPARRAGAAKLVARNLIISHR